MRQTWQTCREKHLRVGLIPTGVGVAIFQGIPLTAKSSAFQLLTSRFLAELTHLHSKWSILCIDHIRHLVVYLVCYFLVPHTHVLCMGSGSATGKKNQVRLVHSLLKYFLKFQLWYWIKNLHYQIFKFVIDNSDISLNCLQHIQKRRNFDAKVTCHQPICLLLHAILSGVGVLFRHTLVHLVWHVTVNKLVWWHVTFASKFILFCMCCSCKQFKLISELSMIQIWIFGSRHRSSCLLRSFCASKHKPESRTQSLVSTANP